MRTLITGGAGFIGSHLARLLLREGHEIVVLDDFSTGSASNLPRTPRLRCQEGSVLDRVAVQKASNGVGLIVHAAGVVGVRLAHAARRAAYEVAVIGTENVLRLQHSVPIVLFSSSAVYGFAACNAGETARISRDEALSLDGGEPGYATGKVELELLGAEAASSGRAVLTLRPFNVVGLGQVSTYGMVIPTFVERALNGMPLHVYDDGAQTRSFSDVETVVRCILKLIGSPNWQMPENVFNVGSPRATSIRELAEMVLRQTKSESQIEFVPYEKIFPTARDVRARHPSVEKLEGVIGKVTWPPVERVIVRCCRMALAQGKPFARAVPEASTLA